MLENWAIVELFWKRSEEALRETSRKYGAYCRTIIRNLLGNRREDVEECENDTLLSAWNAMPTDRPQRLAPFLGRIARNLALDRVDYYTAQKRSCPAQYLLDELSECLPGGQEVEPELEGAALAESIGGFLRGQSRTARVVFVRRYWYGDPVEEIARSTGLSAGNVRTILSRTRARLRAFLSGQGVTI